MARKSRRSKGEDLTLQMAPMIDIVFQLLIFFIVTMKQEDILSKLEVLRPAGESGEPSSVEPYTILIDSRGYLMKGLPLTETRLRESIEKFARYNKNSAVVIKCTLDSPHHLLVKLLDICAENDLNKLAVFSIQ